MTGGDIPAYVTCGRKIEPSSDEEFSDEQAVFFGTFFTPRMRRAWQRHCEILQLTYELDSSRDTALAEMGVARGEVAEAAGGRSARV